MRRWVWALAVLTAGCGQQVLEVPLPDAPGTRSLLVAMRHDDDLTVYALDREAEPSSWQLPALPELRGEVRLAALLYPETLAELGQGPGVLDQDPEGVPPRDPGGGRFLRTVTAGAAGAWAETTTLPTDLAFRLPAPEDTAHCKMLDMKVRNLGELGRVLVAFPEPGGGVLAINRFGVVFRIDETSIVRTGTVGLSNVFAGTRTATGAIWLSGRAPPLAVGTLEGGFQPAPAPPTQQLIRWMATPTRADAPSELFALTRYGVLLRRGEGEWRETPLDLSYGSDLIGALRWLGPDKVAAVAPLWGTVEVVEGGVRADAVRVNIVFGYLTALAELDGQLYGLTDNGLLVAFHPRDYEAVASIPDAAAADSLTTFAGGLLVTTRGPFASHYQVGKSPCPMVGPDSGAYPDTNNITWTAVVSGDVAYLFTSHAIGEDSDSARVVTVRIME
ncbi:MAG: hypothetical protein H6730_23275 [Deltaproteobacteria bacterium]|nr:hypothetical protein [Deltaproteobacteria bacterium]